MSTKLTNESKVKLKKLIAIGKIYIDENNKHK